MNQNELTKMVKDGRDYIEIMQSIPENKRFLVAMVAEAFVSGMQAQEQLTQNMRK